MPKPSMTRFFLCLFLLPSLSLALPGPAPSADDRSRPVTDKLLRSLHLDRRYHRCISIADGDTLTLEKLGTVRFIGIDTPEKNHPKLPVQFLAKESSAFTKKLCMGKKIRLEYDPYDENKRGKYGRVLGYLYLKDGTFVQKQLLINGYATVYTKYPFDEERKKMFLAWERQARQQKRGLWKGGPMTEVLWILEHGQLLIQVEKTPSDHYRLRFGNRISKSFGPEEIVSNLTRLYATAHELAPLDLRKQLAQSGYEKRGISDTAGPSVSVMGMAHKKWGIVVGNHAKPRVCAVELERQIRELFKWIENFDTELLEAALSVNGYGRVPEALVMVDPRKIAGDFLNIPPVGRRDGKVISWDSAGNHIGKRITVQGTIVLGHNSGTACFLNFHRNFTRYMSIAIFENSFRRFPFQPEKFYLNKTIRVTGEIRKYKGRSEIIVNSPRQIEIVKSR